MPDEGQSEQQKRWNHRQQEYKAKEKKKREPPTHELPIGSQRTVCAGALSVCYLPKQRERQCVMQVGTPAPDDLTP